MSENSRRRSDEFLKISGQFKLGALVTEASHPVTARLSEVAARDIAAGLKLLFDVDDDVVRKYREFVQSGRAGDIAETVLHSLRQGGRIFFTGCGATGRLSILLDSVWRDFWQKNKSLNLAADFADRTFSVMAGGDFALIKSVEGFEDFTAFGRKQLRDLGVRAGDVVFAITEGGETSFVIGTAWEGVDAEAKVYFVYNNPDDVLCEHVERSREIIRDPRIEKLNLTTGPMAITGSTRMQATSIQLCVLLTILEMVVQEPAGKSGQDTPLRVPADRLANLAGSVPAQFLAKLKELHANLKSPELLGQLAKLVALEEEVYRAGRKINYFADGFGIDVLTDTTERSPTFCTPPFRKADDTAAAESWAFLFLPQAETPDAWRHLLKREPRCLEWSDADVRELVGEEKFPHTLETLRKISRPELMQFRIGRDGLDRRRSAPGDGAVAIAAGGFCPVELAVAQQAGARTGIVCFSHNRENEAAAAEVAVCVPIPETGLLLDGLRRVAVKLVLNALSTCTMVRLGRVMGNFMVWVVPSNLKLIDRATRYVVQLAGLDYEGANRLLFEVLEYVEPRMKADRAYPPVVGLAVTRARYGWTNEQAEARLNDSLSV